MSRVAFESELFQLAPRKSRGYWTGEPILSRDRFNLLYHPQHMDLQFPHSSLLVLGNGRIFTCDDGHHLFKLWTSCNCSNQCSEISSVNLKRKTGWLFLPRASDWTLWNACWFLGPSLSQSDYLFTFFSTHFKKVSWWRGPLVCSGCSELK